MNGYLGFFRISDWYESLPGDIRAGIFKSADCPGEFGFKGEWLLNGDHHPLQQTATHFLCNIAMNAVPMRLHAVADALLDKAFQMISSKEDRDYFKAISTNIAELKLIHPDQKEIDSFKPAIYTLINDNPGILQSEIKKHFQKDVENTVGLAYWLLYQEGRVSREKRGRTFALFAVAAANPPGK